MRFVICFMLRACQKGGVVGFGLFMKKDIEI